MATSTEANTHYAEEFVCPVCANEIGQFTKDDGETYQCDLCQAIHDGEKRVR